MNIQICKANSFSKCWILNSWVSSSCFPHPHFLSFTCRAQSIHWLNQHASSSSGTTRKENEAQKLVLMATEHDNEWENFVKNYHWWQFFMLFHSSNASLIWCEDDLNEMKFSPKSSELMFFFYVDLELYRFFHLLQTYFYLSTFIIYSLSLKLHHHHQLAGKLHMFRRVLQGEKIKAAEILQIMVEICFYCN